MTVTLEYIRKHAEILIYIEVNIENFYKLLGDNCECINDPPNNITFEIHYYVNEENEEEFIVTYEIMRQGNELIFQTKVEAEMISFLDKVNSMPHIIVDEDPCLL